MTNHPNRNWRRKLEHDAADLGPDLVSAWIAVQTADGWSLAEVGRRLALDFDRPSYNANVLLRWQRGAEAVPGPVAARMRQHVLAVLLLDGATAKAVAKVMEAPDRTG